MLFYQQQVLVCKLMMGLQLLQSLTMTVSVTACANTAEKRLRMRVYKKMAGI